MTYKPIVHSFFDAPTNTISYIVADPVTKKCAIIDSVLDYEPHGATLNYKSADTLIEVVTSHGYTVEWILETHVHADHITAASYLKEKLGGKLAMSKKIVDVQKVFGSVFGENDTFKRDGSEFDVLFEADEEFSVGEMKAKALYVPGHTPADVAYVIGDTVFVGDTIFMPDFGSARCDFPGGSAEMLYDSVHKLFSLPSTMKMYMCHDYLPEGRTEYVWETTIGEEKEKNIHLAHSVTKEQFVTMRTTRDKKLGMPKLIIPSLQVNMKAGAFPKNEQGDIVLKVPVNSVFAKKD